MSRWELWSAPDGTEYGFFPEYNEHARRDVVAEGLVLIWTCEARGANDAMRMCNEHLGWEEYQPMLRPDGTPYPEDEDSRFG
jgi:hypothetical protein